MTFFGRSKELAALNQMYDENTFQMMVVYGRRRIGKTSILNEFVKDKPHLYLSAEEVNDELNLKMFSEQLGRKMGVANFPAMTNWHNFFETLAQQFGQEHMVVVIDEYPYAATANKSLNSTLQHTIDYIFKKTNIFLILCGSSMSFMENQVLGEKSPLFGRRTGQLKVNPLDYLDAAQFYPNASPEDKIKYYATIGGTPYYLSMIKEELTFEENIKRLYFTVSGYLLNEGTLLMRQEFNEPTNYNAILQAIASRAVIPSEIISFTQLKPNIISKYLQTLQELNYIERVIPFDVNPLKTRKSHYRITENFMAFWYRYVFTVRGEIDMGHGDLFCQLALDNLNEFIGPVFEEIARQYLRRQNSSQNLPFIAKSFGTWWGKGKGGESQEIDVVSESYDGKALIIGECKWRNSIKEKKVIDTLINRAKLFPKYQTYPYLFTKEKLKLKDYSPVTVVSAEDFFNFD